MPIIGAFTLRPEVDKSCVDYKVLHLFAGITFIVVQEQ